MNYISKGRGWPLVRSVYITLQCEGINMGSFRWLDMTAEIYGIIYDGEYTAVNA